MDTAPVTPARLRSSVIAVPPLARHADGSLNPGANERLIHHIEAGGVNILLYGGNANLYHVRPSEYRSLLEMLTQLAGPDTLITPSVGPAYGLMMDQAEIARSFDFPTVMVLPQSGITTPAGAEEGIRHFARAYGRPVVVYIKQEGYLNPENVARLADEGLVSWVKYAIVRENPAVDPYLDELVKIVDPSLIVSGIGEQPAIIHLRNFGINGFTAGCVCVRPDLSQAMLRHIIAGDIAAAERIRSIFVPLEDLRNSINPIRVLHEAVALAGIAETGPLQPLMSNLASSVVPAVAEAARALLAATL